MNKEINTKIDQVNKDIQDLSTLIFEAKNKKNFNSVIYSKTISNIFSNLEILRELVKWIKRLKTYDSQKRKKTNICIYG